MPKTGDLACLKGGLTGPLLGYCQPEEHLVYNGEHAATWHVGPCAFCLSGYESNIGPFRPNKERSWFQVVVAALPPFWPCLITRRCADETCLNCPEKRDKV